jgi:hypothetical protein
LLWGGEGGWHGSMEEARAKGGGVAKDEQKIFSWLELFGLGDVVRVRKTPSTSSTLASVPSGGLLSFWISRGELFSGVVVYKKWGIILPTPPLLWPPCPSGGLLVFPLISGGIPSSDSPPTRFFLHPFSRPPVPVAVPPTSRCRPARGL